MKRLLAPVFGFALLGAAALPVYADDVGDAITARQAFMQVNKFYMGILSSMAKGKRDYDAALASAAANNIAALSTLKNGAMWPKNSGLDQPGLEEETSAKPEIWSTWPEVSNRHKDWADAAANLAKVAGNGLDAMRGGLKDVGGGCKGCHDDFRAKKN